MSDNNQKNLNSRAVPFFARYLEGQSIEDLSTEEIETVKGGNVDLTKFNIFSKKYPSDHEDQLGSNMAMTRKYPSDHEDGSGHPIMATMKYPSDSDDR